MLVKSLIRDYLDRARGYFSSRDTAVLASQHQDRYLRLKNTDNLSSWISNTGT